MSLLRTSPLSSSRLRTVSTIAALGTVLLAGLALTACSSSSLVEPTASSQSAAPTGPNRTGTQVGWGVTSIPGASTQTAAMLAPASKDSTKAKTK